MRKPLTTVLAAGTLLAIAACSSNSTPRPATVRNYGQEATTYAQSAPQPPSQPTYQPVSSPSGPVQWHATLAQAQSAARSTGRLILVATTKPGCSLCEKFKTQIVPATSGELQRIAVPYMYDITRPESGQLDQLLRANLKNASLMPLVGFVTPDLRWVSGFWGARSAAEFRGDIATASRLHPVRTASVAGPMRTVAGPTMASVVNEYGETEWSRPGDVWPTTEPDPIDAITGAPDRLMDPSMGANAPVLADTTPHRRSVGAAPAAPAAASRPPAPSTLPPLTSTQPVRIASNQRTSPWSAPVDLHTSAASDPYANQRLAPVEAPVERALTPAHSGVDAWGRNALDRALAQIREGRYEEARSTLAEVRSRLPESTLAREANKGNVALYNAKRIRMADSSDERDRYLSRAQRDLGSSMWSSLFTS